MNVSRRGMSTYRLLALSGAAIVCAISLQGCNIAVPRHIVGNWEAKENYLVQYDFKPPAKVGKNGLDLKVTPILNSCSDPDIPTTLQCGGHGKCDDWNDLDDVWQLRREAAKRLSFCKCDRDWADPECRTPRKSQVTAFLLSMFVGWLGVDQLYLGFPVYAVLKLITLGGCGAWYLYDLCRIGSSPVLTHYNFRVADDLPHFAFVLSVVSLMLLIGFVIAIRSIMNERTKKAHEILLLRTQVEEEEEEEEEVALPPTAHLQYSMKQPAPPTTTPLRSTNFSGYGSTLPRSMPAPPTRPAADMSPGLSGRIIEGPSRFLGTVSATSLPAGAPMPMTTVTSPRPAMSSTILPAAQGLPTVIASQPIATPPLISSQPGSVVFSAGGTTPISSSVAGTRALSPGRFSA